MKLHHALIAFTECVNHLSNTFMHHPSNWYFILITCIYAFLFFFSLLLFLFTLFLHSFHCLIPLASSLLFSLLHSFGIIAFSLAACRNTSLQLCPGRHLRGNPPLENKLPEVATRLFLVLHWIVSILCTLFYETALQLPYIWGSLCYVHLCCMHSYPLAAYDAQDILRINDCLPARDNCNQPVECLLWMIVMDEHLQLVVSWTEAGQHHWVR